MADFWLTRVLARVAVPFFLMTTGYFLSRNHWVLFRSAAVREQLEVSSDNPKAFDGFPIALVTAGLMALAFMGFSGLKVW